MLDAVTRASQRSDGQHAHTPPQPRSKRRPEDEHGFRPDVQGLRAIAVGLVVLYHLYPSRLPGGYIGVDVFFVISGFLITGHLARGLDRSGRVRLLDFYGRRARRLLPAAAVVLTATWLAAKWLLPVTQLPATAEQIRGSALYFQNWILAHDAVDYLARDDAPSPVQHFWSLSVEEQFYLVWPWLFLTAGAVAVVIARRARAHRTSAEGAAVRGRVAGRLTVLALAAGVVVASLVYSIVETERNPAAAYFVTTTRMWELGLGGVLALLPGRITRVLGRVGVLAWLGLGMIVASAFLISDASAFPGSIALLPVGGAVLMLACGSRAARLSPARLTSSRPFVFIGDISYSVYLWHWPLIVLWLAYRGGSIGVIDGPLIVIATLVLSWLTKVLVEDTVRRNRMVTRHVSVSLATATTVLVPAILVTIFIATEPGPFNGKLDKKHPGAGALAIATPRSPVKTPAKPASRAELVPPLIEVPRDLPLTSHNGCEADTYETAVKRCSFGDTTHPRLTVALVGDSHAGQWSSALRNIAKREHWKIVAELHVACRWTSTMTVLYGKPYTACHDWGSAVMDDLITNVRPDVVIMSGRPNLGTVDHPNPDPTSWAQIGTGMADYARQLIAHDIKVVAIHETPEPGREVPDCLAARNGSIERCGTPAKEAVLRHTPIDVAGAELGRKLPVVNMNDLICGPKTCAPVVGNVVVYRDKHHLGETYTVSLQPYLQQRLIDTGAFAS